MFRPEANREKNEHMEMPTPERGRAGIPTGIIANWDGSIGNFWTNNLPEKVCLRTAAVELLKVTSPKLAYNRKSIDELGL